MIATPEPPPTCLARTTLQYQGVLVPKLGYEPDVTAHLVYACVFSLGTTMLFLLTNEPHC